MTAPRPLGFERNRSKVAAIVIALISIPATLGALAVLFAAPLPWALLFLGGPLGFFLALSLWAQDRVSLPLGICVAVSWLVGGVVVAVKEGRDLVLAAPAGLLGALFILALVFAARLRPGEEEDLDDDLLLEPRRLPVPEEGLHHPVAKEVVDQHLPLLDQEWPGFADEARREGLLPVYADYGGWIGLRRDAALIEVAWDDAPRPLALAHARLRTMALVEGQKKYPPLAAFLPARPEAAKDCSFCEGQGSTKDELRTSPVPCRRCGALGWVRP